MKDFWNDRELIATLNNIAIYKGNAADAFRESNLNPSIVSHFSRCQERKLNKKTLDKLARFARKRAEELRENARILREIADTLEDRVKAQEWRNAA